MTSPKLIDLHADTITSLYDLKFANNNESDDLNVTDSLAANRLQIDLERMKAAGSLAQFFVLWINLMECKKKNLDPWQHFLQLQKFLLEQIENNSTDIVFAYDNAQLKTAQRDNKIAGMLAIEEGGIINSLEDLAIVKSLGVRYITLVWNYETHIGVPCKIDQTRGLKPFGFEMVRRMQELDILVDISHLSDQGANDVLSIANKPIMATHSNARSLCSYARNLPDALIKQIANNGGVIGICCGPNFLDDNDKTITLDKIIAHIRHIYNIGGEDVLAIGNDFDGYVKYTPHLDAIKDISDVPKLGEALLLAKFPPMVIEKIFNGNILRLLAI